MLVLGQDLCPKMQQAQALPSRSSQSGGETDGSTENASTDRCAPPREGTWTTLRAHTMVTQTRATGKG